MLKKYSINYIEHWSEDGAHYDQTVNIDQKTLESIAQEITNEIHHPEKTKEWDHIKKMYFKKPFEFRGSLVFMNLTQRDFVAGLLFKNKEPRFLDRNTCLNIINLKENEANSAIVAKCAEIRHILATNKMPKEYSAQILRQIGSIEATIKKSI